MKSPKAACKHTGKNTTMLPLQTAGLKHISNVGRPPYNEFC